MREATQQLPIAYRGRRTSRGTIVEAQPSTATWYPLDPRNHSPTGFEWGYGGSEPAQLARALAASRLPETLARTVYQRLKRALVASLDHAWHLSSDRLDALLAELLSAGIAADPRTSPGQAWRADGPPMTQLYPLSYKFRTTPLFFAYLQDRCLDPVLDRLRTSRATSSPAPVSSARPATGAAAAVTLGHGYGTNAQ
jgi:Family of unknown function (DUF6166)